MIISNTRLLLPLLALLLSGVSYAGAHKSSPPGGYGSGGMDMGMGMHKEMGMMPRMGEKLGLSEAQKQDMAALMEMYGPRFKELAARGKADREALMAMAPDDAGYGELTAAVSQEAGLAAAEAVTLMSELQGTVYALLTPEQQVKYLELRAAQKEKMREHREQRKACMSEDGATREGCMDMHKGKGMHKGMHQDMHKRHQMNCDGEDCPYHPPATEPTQP
jgi:Spy/CpxP family protein refolding chaperone